jgi:hypothetical protein
MGGMNCPTAIKGTLNHAKTSFSTEIFAGAIISVVQYLVPLRSFRSVGLDNKFLVVENVVSSGGTVDMRNWFLVS